jgi:hypothetical protein
LQGQDNDGEKRAVNRLTNPTISNAIPSPRAKYPNTRGSRRDPSRTVPSDRKISGANGMPEFPLRTIVQEVSSVRLTHIVSRVIL